MSIGVTSSQPSSLVSMARAGDGSSSCWRLTSCRACTLATFCFFQNRYAPPAASAAMLRNEKCGMPGTRPMTAIRPAATASALGEANI